jgi:putative nucleotidyltransferase with HDIG domain
VNLDERSYPWLAELEGCPQDPVFHGEGDVLTHTRMVAGELVALEGWGALGEQAREELLLAALLHDVGKPASTVVEGGRVRSPGHSARGARRARRELWLRGLEPAARERIAWLVRLHLVPFHALERDDPVRSVIRASLVAGCRPLALLAEADARGRVADDAEELLDAVALFAALAEETGCLDRGYPFATDHSRFTYLRTPGRDPAYAAYEDRRCTVTLMSGLPGAGKNRWLADHAPELPVVSLDAIRGELGVDPDDNQTPVVALARERAREHLRAGVDFAWNATNVTPFTREPAIELFAAYGARVEVVALEATPETLAQRNTERERPLPEAVRERLAERWEPPSLLEAHAVQTVVTG